MANIRDPAQEIVNNVDYQEDYGRRLNLRFSGIADHHRNENWENSEALVRKLIKSTLGVEKEIEVERAHRTGKWSKDPTKPRDIIIRFTKFKDRDLVLKKRNMLKETDIFINEDFCTNTMNIRQDLRFSMYEARRARQIAYISRHRLKVRSRNRPFPTSEETSGTSWAGVTGGFHGAGGADGAGGAAGAGVVTGANAYPLGHPPARSNRASI